MIISNYLKMNYDELGQEIVKQKKKIETAKETIRLLEKLQIAVTAQANQQKQQNGNPSNQQNNNISNQQKQNGDNHGRL